MTETISTGQLLGLRMRALGLAGEALSPPGRAAGAQRIAAVARRMLAVQGQDWRSSRWALGLRAPGTGLADVHAAFDEGLIVRSWPMRGTIHVVAAQDIGWMQRATNHRVLSGAPKRREYLGMSDAVLDRLVEVSMEALTGLAAEGSGLDRDSLAATWTEAGIEWQGNWRYHLIWWLCQNGLAVFGPARGGEPLLVRADEWIRDPRSLEGDEALAELAARYAEARGPIRERDLAWWTGLTVREARQAIALASESGRLAPLRLDGAAGAAGALWAHPRLLTTSSVDSASDPWLMLPAFDEHLLGYTDREAQLDPAHFERIVPGRNGMFLATVVADGRVVGTWRRGTRKPEGLELSALPGERIDVDALAPAATRWSAFHGQQAPALTLTDPAVGRR
jgi:hypothetical protein